MIFLSVTAQRHIETSHSIILCVATLLNLISLFFLIHDTPPNQAKIRNYLLLTQVYLLHLWVKQKHRFGKFGGKLRNERKHVLVNELKRQFRTVQ